MWYRAYKWNTYYPAVQDLSLHLLQQLATVTMPERGIAGTIQRYKQVVGDDNQFCRQLAHWTYKDLHWHTQLKREKWLHIMLHGTCCFYRKNHKTFTDYTCILRHNHMTKELYTQIRHWLNTGLKAIATIKRQNAVSSILLRMWGSGSEKSGSETKRCVSYGAVDACNLLCPGGPLSIKTRRDRIPVAMVTISEWKSPSTVGFTTLHLGLVGQTLLAFPIPTLTLHWIVSIGITLRRGGRGTEARLVCINMSHTFLLSIIRTHTHTEFIPRPLLIWKGLWARD